MPLIQIAEDELNDLRNKLGTLELSNSQAVLLRTLLDVAAAAIQLPITNDVADLNVREVLDPAVSVRFEVNGSFDIKQLFACAFMAGQGDGGAPAARSHITPPPVPNAPPPPPDPHITLPPH